MNSNSPNSGILAFASDRLTEAMELEHLKPVHAPHRHTPFLAFHVAHAVKLNSPEAFDFTHPVDAAAWVYVGN